MSNQIPVHDVTPPNKNANNSVDLYASREKIYTRAFTGLFRNLRMMGGITDLGSSSSAATLTDTIGTNEGITGGTWFVGNSDGTNASSVCSAKTISNFSNVVGICPEGRRQKAAS